MLGARAHQDPVVKAAYDQAVCKALEEIIIAHNYRVIHCYIPISSEINVNPLLSNLLSMERTVVCPKTLPKPQLENRILKSMDALETGIMGTLHPAEAHVYDGPCDLIIVPGLAFDADNYRLGYGGGYYDNFLKNHPEAITQGIFYPFQKVAKVPLEPHDVQLHSILALN